MTSGENSDDEADRRAWVLEQLPAVVRAGGDPNTECPDGRPLVVAATLAALEWDTPEAPRLVGELLKMRADPNRECPDGETALGICVRKEAACAAALIHARTARTVGVLLQAKADPLALNVAGQSALHAAAIRGRSAVALALIQSCGEDMAAVLRLPDQDGFDPVDLAAYFGNGRVCAELVRAGGSLAAKEPLEGRWPWAP